MSVMGAWRPLSLRALVVHQTTVFLTQGPTRLAAIPIGFGRGLKRLTCRMRPSSKLNNQTLREWPVLGQVALRSGGAAEVRSLEQRLDHLMQSGAVDMTAETLVQAIAKMDVFVRAPVRIEAFGRGDAARVHHR